MNKQARMVDIQKIASNYIEAMLYMLKAQPLLTVSTLIATIISGIVPVTQIYLIAQIVQAAGEITIGGNAYANILQPLFMLALVMIGSHLLAMISQYLSRAVQVKIGSQVESDLIAVSAGLNLQDFENYQINDKLQRAAQDAGGGEITLLFDKTLSTLTEVVSLVSIFYLLVMWNPIVAIMILISPLPSAFATIYYGRVAYEIEYERAQSRRRLDYYKMLVSSDSSFKELKTFDLGGRFVNLCSDLIREFKVKDLNLAKRQTVTIGCLGLFSVVGTVISIALAVEAAVGVGDIGKLTAYLQSITTVFSSMLMLMSSTGLLIQMSLLIGDIFEVLKYPGNGESENTGELLDNPVITLSIKNLSFTYPNTNRPVLENVSLEFKKGELVAVVGENGSGKSTFLKLLSRLYPTPRGSIFVNGIDAQDISPNSYRRSFGVMFQDFVKYEMRVRDGVGMGDIERISDSERIFQALKQVGLERKVNGLVDGLDTILGRKFVDGVQFSGGEWQRLALARTIFRKDASILMLDEPTAAIDYRTEKLLGGELRELARDRIGIIITHRKEIVESVDRVVLFSKGRVVATGSHSELTATSSEYRKLMDSNLDHGV